MSSCRATNAKGKRRKGKRQLHEDEARRWVALALERAREPGLAGDAAFAALLALMLGARAGEVAHRQCRDVDADGAVLWITESKTEAGRRRCAVPEFLRAELVARARRRGPDEPLFPGLDRWRMRAVNSLTVERGPKVVQHD